MAFRPIHKLAVGAAFVGGVLGGSCMEGRQEDRPEFPDGLVCMAELEPGESPHSLAEDSVFADNAASVIQRSQFINPDAVLSFAKDDEKSFDGVFNVLRGDKPSDVPDNRPYVGGNRANCTTDEVDRKVASTFPSLAASEMILRSTIALREGRPSNDVYGHWRCGAVAVSDSIAILTSTDFITGSHGCEELEKGESDTNVFGIASDTNVDGYRLIQVSKGQLEPAEIAPADYQPVPGEVLVYSGYTRGGSRAYFRVRFLGEKDGRMVFHSNIDRLDPDAIGFNNEPAYMDITSGSGGLFNIKGQLVATLESTNGYNESRAQSGTPLDEAQVRHNTELTEYLETFGIDSYSGTHSYSELSIERMMFGLRVPTEIVTTVDASGG